MSGALVIARRELSGLFKAPFAWVLLLIVLLLNGMVFRALLVQTGGNVSTTLDGVMTGRFFLFWLMLLPPLLSMRLVAEETRTGTLEYLLTAPVSDASVVVGKFLAALGFLAVLWSTPLIYAVGLQFAGGAPDWSAVVGTWIGTLLMSGVFVSIGLLTGTLTGTPLLAVFLGVAACAMWMTLPFWGERIAELIVPLVTGGAASAARAQEVVDGLLVNMDAVRHFQRSFKIGVLDTSEVVFFVTWTAFFLFITTRSLEARRWRG